MAFIIGLTGGIGSGKSTVAGIFSVLGIPVYDADRSAKRLMNENKALKTQILKHFGEAAYENGQLNRKYIAGIVFNNEAKLKLLNSLVHPYTIADAHDWAVRQTSPYVIKEAALMFESASFHYVQRVIGVSAPLPLRIQRVVRRDGLTPEEVRSRIQRQLAENIKLKLCDDVVTNNEQELLVPQILTLHQKLLALAQ
jgi:dephospho-CoA kinase